MKPTRLLTLLLLAALFIGGAGLPARAAEITLAVVPSWETDGEQTGSDYGAAVSLAGDVDGDGFGDVLVSAPLASEGVYREGAVYAFHGRDKYGLSGTPAWIEGSQQTGSAFGTTLAALGDLNADGYDDVIISAPAYDLAALQPDAGAVFLYMGAEGGLAADPAWSVQGDKKEIELGNAIDAAGYINDDEYLDLVVGVHHFTDGLLYQGQVRVYYGIAAAPYFDSASYWSYTLDQANSLLGASVAGLGDVDGNGFDDFAVGAPYFNTDVPNAGKVIVFYGSASGLSIDNSWQATGATEDELFSKSIAGAGDLNQDGFTDLIVGAPGYDSTAIIDAGAVYVYLGSEEGLSDLPAVIWEGPQTNTQIGADSAQFGSAVSGAGDINADGFLDVIVGAPYYTDDQQDEGGIFAYYGRKHDLAAAFDWRSYGQKADTLYGFSVASAGDVDGDGYGDILAGAPNYMVNKIAVGHSAGFYGEYDTLYLYIPMIVKQGSGE